MLIKNKDTLLTPIVTSILDTDAYKLHMQQAVFHHYSDVHVAAEFHCRDKDQLGEYAAFIQHHVQLMHHVQLSAAEGTYLKQLPFFQPDYLQWLKHYRFNPDLVHIRNYKGRLHVRIEGKWLDVILWEVPLLAIISEVVHKDRTPQLGIATAIDQLQKKLARFDQEAAGTDLSHFQIMEFGTRRRYSKDVQKAVIRYLKDHFVHFSRTSNYALARELNLTPVGTQAHEWFQAHQQLVPHLADFQREALATWLKEYPTELSIALTDCLSMDAFLRDFNPVLASRYSGLRQDSGDPIVWGEKAIAHYKKLHLDPKEKVLVFSDSLTLTSALKIYRHFHQQTQLSFGIGSHLSCDLPASPTLNTKILNIVIKLVECNGKPVAKLSDTPGKSMSGDERFIKQLKSTFNLPTATNDDKN